MRRRAHHLVSAISIVTLSLALGASQAFADDPDPIDPTGRTSGDPGGAPPPPTPADWDTWWNYIIPLLQAIAPEATYDELCYAAYIMFNLLPPEEPPPEGGDGGDLPPDEPPPEEPPPPEDPPPPETGDAAPTRVQ